MNAIGTWLLCWSFTPFFPIKFPLRYSMLMEMRLTNFHWCMRMEEFCFSNTGQGTHCDLYISFCHLFVIEYTFPEIFHTLAAAAILKWKCADFVLNYIFTSALFALWYAEERERDCALLTIKCKCMWNDDSFRFTAKTNTIECLYLRMTSIVAACNSFTCYYCCCNNNNNYYCSLIRAHTQTHVFTANTRAYTHLSHVPFFKTLHHFLFFLHFKQMYCINIHLFWFFDITHTEAHSLRLQNIIIYYFMSKIVYN